MKRKNWSRIISIVLAGVMVVGGISFSAYAEEFISDIEGIVEESMQFDDMNEINIDGEGIVIEEPATFENNDIMIDDENPILNVEEVETEVSESETELSIYGEELAVTIEGEVDTAEIEAQQNENETVITLNYENYTLGMAGETVQLIATVDMKNGHEDAVSEMPEVMEKTEETAEENEFNVTEFVEEPTYDVIWGSSDESVATVDEKGIVSAVAAGEVIITCALADDLEVSAICIITVTGECTLKEHVHSREECFVRELICSHISDEEHTDACFINKFVCGMEEHVHDENCFYVQSMSDEDLATMETYETENIEETLFED